MPPILNGLPYLLEDTYECNEIPDVADVTATDNCDDDVNVLFSSYDTKNHPSNVVYNITRTWTASDKCGNSVKASRNLIIQDSTSPILNCQSCDELFVGCDHIPLKSIVTASDNCDSLVALSIQFSEIREDGSCEFAYTLIRKWVSEDSSGNSAFVTQVINIVDNVAPILYHVPADEMRECDKINLEPIVNAKDNCVDNVIVSLEVSVIDKISLYDYKTVRVWTVADLCGMISTGSQTLHIVDTRAPELSQYPSGISVEIDAVKTTWPGTITATDNCDGDVPVKFSQKREHGSCHHAYTLIRTWMSQDDRGNVGQHQQTVVLNDYTPPVLVGVPGDTIVDFEERYTIPTLSSVIETITVSDNSGSAIDVTGTENKIEQHRCGSTYNLIRSFMATDACGNEVIQKQNIQIVDNVSPVINEPDHEIVECDAIPKKCNVEVIANPDHPDYGLTISSMQEKIAVTAPNNYKLIRKWWVDDCAGNRASYVQTITVQDTTPPVFSRLPENEESECKCDDSQGVDVEALDNCDLSVIDVTMEESKVDVNNVSPDNFMTYRTWTASDTSGNKVSYTQTITVTDSIPPEFCEDTPAPPEKTFIQCDAVPPKPDLKFSDNCDPDVNVQFFENKKKVACANAYILIRTWKASDRTGNVLEHSHTIQVSDDEDGRSSETAKAHRG
eukprot:TRINITY_DN258_c0_g2_i14.p1 TRINITY_DN258_c0_g2~~TRINITY_DN258_c0_g2_i14.p1  ORF type:complete len:673 (+),score=179.84 TRINITY_DN258_c0_g2_i14:1165-3183(+)